MIDGASIRAYRQRNRIKQEALAAMLGVSQAHVSRVEAGTVKVRGALLARLESLLSDPAQLPCEARLIRLTQASPHLVFVLKREDEDVKLLSQAAIAPYAGRPFAALKAGETVIGRLGEDAESKLMRVMEMGAFEGRVDWIEAVWRFERAEARHDVWRTVLIPMPTDDGRWLLHASVVPCEPDDAAAFEAEWEGGVGVHWRGDRSRPMSQDGGAARCAAPLIKP